jgi:hypothetical protein
MGIAFSVSVSLSVYLSASLSLSLSSFKHAILKQNILQEKSEIKMIKILMEGYVKSHKDQLNISKK